MDTTKRLENKSLISTKKKKNGKKYLSAEFWTVPLASDISKDSYDINNENIMDKLKNDINLLEIRLE